MIFPYLPTLRSLFPNQSNGSKNSQAAFAQVLARATGNPTRPDFLSSQYRDHTGTASATQEKGRAPSGCPPLLPLGNLSAAAAVQQAVVVEALTTAGLAVLVYVNWHCAGVVAAVT